ncbi:DNA cytosine methyltransferase [Sphingomonas sp. ID0503]|uniref:DNA cytosine methyltransferase n=1 Tax=Sphingomonas sp. ID0503 TaxID=3399691 RepID=UPI003AFB0338
MLDVLDLFSAAAGGWSLGMHRAGYRTIAACEAVAWRRALYAENNPGVILYDDVRTLTADRLRRDLGRLPSIVVGSPPCQDISSANTKGKGVNGERSGLYFEAVRIIGEVRPRWFALENSANLRTRGADAVIAALETIGYSCWPVVVRAGDIGANHERPRCWLIGCDVEQVADPNGFGWHGERGRGRSGLDLSIPNDPFGCARVRHEGGRARGHRPHGLCAASASGTNAADTQKERCIAWAGIDEGSGRENDGYEFADDASSGSSRNTPDPDQARQAHGCMEPGLRQTEIADDGRGIGWGDDGSGTGQVAVCAPDRSDAVEGGPLWSLEDLAHHLWLDDGLSARLAGARADVGDGKGQSAASLIVEAFGDAVIPQIPEAIGRAILRTERALLQVFAP